MKRIPIALVIFSIFPHALHAQPAPALQPLDELQEKLEKTKKNPAFRKMQKALELLQDGKFGEAQRLIPAFQKQKEFADYVYWMTSEIALDEARHAKEPSKSAQKVINEGVAILRDHPYSPFYRTILRAVGQAELVVGAASCGPKKYRSCKEKIEAGLQRLSLSGDLGAARPEQLEKYGEACAKEPSEFCGAWLSRLSVIFSKASPEYKAMMRAKPALPEKQKGIYGVPRISKSYRAPDLDQVAFDAAMNSYLDQKFSAAAVSFRQFLDDYPRSGYRFRAEYWLAQALAHEQKHADAQKLYQQLQTDSPLTYYGLLASMASGHDISGSISATVPQAATADRALNAFELYRVRRAEKLIRSGAPKLAAFELKDVRAREAISSPFLLYLMLLNDEAGNYSGSFQLLSELIHRQYEGMNSTYVLRFIFPTPYMELIRANADENKLDPILVMSLIKQESSFDATATSSTGAQGLMQLMPSTALDVTADLCRYEMCVPKNNVRTGTKYLARLMNRFNGNIVLSLAAYNAGPGAVDRWVKASPSKRGMLEFIESIPYKETREYVASIIRNYFWYSRKLGTEKPKTLSYFWNVYGPPEKSGELPAKLEPVSED